MPKWEAIEGAKRDRFTAIPILEATEPGAEATLEFSGTAIGAYVLAGPDAGIAEVSIDGGPFVPFDFLHAFSGGLHYPRTVMFAMDLKKSDAHTMTIRVSKETHSKGHALRIMRFVAN